MIYIQQSACILSKHFSDIDTCIYPYNQYSNQDTENI